MLASRPREGGSRPRDPSEGIQGLPIALPTRTCHEAFSRGCWTPTTIDAIPARPGCYAIIRDNELVYIGSANNVRARLQDFGIGSRRQRRETHFGQVDRLRVKAAVDRFLMEHLTREARLIQRLQPPLNRTTWRTAK